MSTIYILTGASRGLGEALALRLLSPGNVLLCLARTRSTVLDREAEAAGVALEWIKADLAELAAGDGVEALLKPGLERAGFSSASRLRLVNNAGVLEPIGPAQANDPEAVARHIAVNLTAPLLLTGAFLRLTEQLAADKRILQISSGAARKPYAGWSTYGAAKAGLDHHARCVKLEQEGMPHGARIASVAPGVIDTSMQAQIRGTEEELFPSRSRFVQLHETGGLLSPDTAAEQLLALLEDPRFGEEPVMDIRDWER
ncbi:SDR family NAD(P)-dependent oxidoreductase [Paenibacillus aurantius]|uniref:SDR family NAD(P)-dependent oxidoreductase n=1 Tax=Paenibacillus aurantius TaxID=2918900 RepID=A0AA96LBT3_9BACL|nr:SDR family NAD(P)-dependent oxidoreductase [Paenibacillus aurantius]WNQ10716.1 SDR family NAD(P)-dependent oxidoreductase [Paenibacillus aurantius]